MPESEPRKSRPRARLVANNSMWLALDAAIAMPVSLALSVLVARSIGPDVLGVYNFANWILGAGIVVVTNGVTYGMQLFTAEKLGQGDVAGARAVLAHGLRWQVGLSALLVTVGIALTLLFSPPQFRLALIVAVVSIAPAILLSVPAAGLGAAQAFSANVASSIAAVLVNLTAAVAALSAGWGLTGVTAALLLSRVVDASGRYIAWQRVLRTLEAEAEASGALEHGGLDAPRLQTFAFRSSLLILVELVVWDRSEFLVLTRFSALRELAFYSLSFNIVSQVLVLPNLLGRALSANLQVERGSDPTNVTRLSRDGMRYVFLLAAPLTLGLASLDRAIIPLLYGPNYAGAVPVLTVVAALAVMRGALGPVQSLLTMSEKQPFLIRFNVALGCLNIALDLWLIPRYGAIGAAWANGLSQGLAAVGLTAYASRRLGLSVPIGDMGRILLACAPMAITVRALAEWLPHWHAALLGVPLGAALYMAGLRGLKIIRPVDRTRLESLDRTLPRSVRGAYRRAITWVAAAH